MQWIAQQIWNIALGLKRLTLVIDPNRTRPQQSVVCAAHRNRKTSAITLGARHFDNLVHAQNKARAEGQLEWINSEQGFIDQFGKFLTREEAYTIAKANGQIIRRCGGDTHKLFSKNLY